MPPIEHVDNITHEEARRSNIPTSELQPLVPKEQQRPIRVAYKKRDPDLDPQLVWRGKFDGADELEVKAPPLYIQEKVHPKALVEDLLRLGKGANSSVAEENAQYQLNLFSDFNGIPPEADRTAFYSHEQNWTNRMILGDSLQVMASLAEREGLAGKVQAIYIDPPYGIKFNSNFQWSTTGRGDTGDKPENFTREPEQVKAFRDTWSDGIHSYLSYLRDRLILARELLTESGSVFVQIGDENVHRVRALMEEIFGEDNFVSQISFATTTGFSTSYLSSIFNHVIWYAKDIKNLKYNQLFYEKKPGDPGATLYKEVSTFSALKGSLIPGARLVTSDQLTSQGAPQGGNMPFKCQNKKWLPPNRMHWKTTVQGLERLDKASRVMVNKGFVRYLRFLDDFPVAPLANLWSDTSTGGFNEDKIYVVQTNTKVIERCLLMATDPGDLVLDPTCGSGTTAYVAEQWGRRWITIDTSRVALALARARLMGAKYPYYLMRDSPEGAAREKELGGQPLAEPYGGNVRLGLVCQRVPHITLKAIANNAEIDEIWNKWQTKLGPLLERLNKAMKENWQEWEVPLTAAQPWPRRACELHKLLGKAYKVKMPDGKIRPLLVELNEILGSHYKKIEQLPEKPESSWPEPAASLHAEWRAARLARQAEIDASIAARAEFETLHDRPYEDKKRVRVAGPFTVESISPHRALDVGPDDEIIDPLAPNGGESRGFAEMILQNLSISGLQRAHKEDKINFTSLTPWPGRMVCAEGRWLDGDSETRAAIFIGPEFGTVSRADLVQAAREAAESGFDCLVACGFNYEAQASELSRLGALPILQARMNSDLQMGELKNTGKGNLFVIFGEPDIELLPEEKDGKPTGSYRVKIRGVDVYYPNKGEIRSDNADDLACWFVDTDYNGESFFVRQAYFLGQNDPYKALKSTLRAEIDREAWESLHSDTSRPFPAPASGLIAVKAINCLGDEVMKVFRVPEIK